jgi:hypothetical protein
MAQALLAVRPVLGPDRRRYANAAAAAHAEGVSLPTMHDWIAQRTFQYVKDTLPPAGHSPDAPRRSEEQKARALKTGFQARPVTLDNVTYPSTRAAAAALGVSRSTIHSRTRGPRDRRKPVARPVIFNNVHYESVLACATAQKVSINSIYHRIARGQAHYVGAPGTAGCPDQPPAHQPAAPPAE